MLQFISGRDLEFVNCMEFKNISCYSLSRNSLSLLLILLYLKTSHVTVYRSGSVVKGERMHLKTSHVTVYHSGAYIMREWLTYLKTSHVTVYRLSKILPITSKSFKNISCYSLSLSMNFCLKN